MFAVMSSKMRQRLLMLLLLGILQATVLKAVHHHPSVDGPDSSKASCGCPHHESDDENRSSPIAPEDECCICQILAQHKAADFPNIDWCPTEQVEVRCGFGLTSHYMPACVGAYNSRAPPAAS